MTATLDVASMYNISRLSTATQIEVEHIWPSKMSIMKALYLYTRYLAIVDILIPIPFHFYVGITPVQCKTLFSLVSAFNLFGIACAEVIMAIRTWALWERSRNIGLGLFATAIVVLTTVGYIEGAFMKSVALEVFPSATRLPGCILVAENPALGASFIVVILVEILLVVLTLIKGVQRFQLAGLYRSRGLVHTLYRDGVLFFIYNLGISILNFVLVVTIPNYGSQIMIE
ncbi:hypothetical protein EIP91_004269 [Steccherinum ochraceum]|uniref:Uncharacterized protein n=1 Tax=Steccherinum ochraceum TaxID=92696 RepID=A0A4R0R936_9APHY|nr:hypothetical protein EIP91_004269 [Steccherinum ochraceum]